MAISLFQLGAQAWLDPQMVAQSVLATEAAELLPWAGEAIQHMSAADIEPGRIRRFQAVSKNLEDAIECQSSQKVHRSKEKLARLVAGMKDKTKWAAVVQRSIWSQRIQKKFRPPPPLHTSEFHTHILGQLTQNHKPGKTITSDLMREGLLPNRVVVEDLFALIDANIEDVTGGAFASLTPSERVVMHLRYGIPLKFTGDIQGGFAEYEIAKLLGLSKVEIVQLERDAAQKLGEHGFDLWARTRKIKSDLPLEESAKRRLSEKKVPWGNVLSKRNLSGFIELSSYLRLRGLSPDCFEQLQDRLIKFPKSPLHYGVIFAEGEIFIPDEIFGRAMADWKSLILEFVSSEAAIGALIAAIEDRKPAPETIARFLAQIDIREWDLELAEYIYRGCPLDVDIYSGYRKDCSSGSCDYILKFYDLFVEELSDSGVITYHLKSSFCYELVTYYAREIQILREQFGLPALDVWETIFFSVKQDGGESKKIDLKGLLMPGRKDRRRGINEMDMAIMKNMDAAMAMVENQLPQMLMDLFDSERIRGLKTDDDVKNLMDQFSVAHHRAVQDEIRDEIRPVKELKEAGFPLTGDLFRRYAAASDRAAKIEETKMRARELASGSSLGSMEEPFEVMAVLRILGPRAPSLSTVLAIIEQAEIPDRSPEVYSAPFTIPAVPLVKPFFSVANKGLLEKYAQEIRDVNTLVGSLKNFTGNKGARRAVQKWLDALEAIPHEKTLVPEQREKQKNVLGILAEIWGGLQIWLTEDRVEELAKIGRESGLDHELAYMRASKQAVKEIDVYLKSLLICLVIPQDDGGFYEPIIHFDRKKANQEETYQVMDRLSEFYERVSSIWEAAMFGEEAHYPLPTSLQKILNSLETMTSNRKNLSATGETKDITLSPITGKLAAFYGYLSENCLARSDWAVHGMRETGFVPYFILVDGECQGAVQTFTKIVSIDGVKKKMLIVTGVDPQLRLTPDPSAFMEGLENGFGEIAAAGAYDLVVVPAADFAQSSRRALLRHEFDRYTEKVKIDEPIGFPQVGIQPNGSPLYYHNEAHGEARHQEFLVFRSAPHSS